MRVPDAPPPVSEPTSGDPPSRGGDRDTRPLLWILIAALPVFFLSLGANSIWDANEAFYVETPKQMVVTGDYLNPTFNASPRFNKPVLSYWIVAGLFQLFGISVAVERLGIAIGAIGIILAAFLIGRALRSNSAGLLAALIVATSPRMVVFARRIFIDVYITLFMSLALAGFVLALRHPVHRRRYLALMYVAIGLGMLTKGPVALVLPAVVCLAWLVIERRLQDIRQLMIAPGVLIVLAIVAPWYVADYRQHGWTHIIGFFVGENLERFASSFAGERPFWYFVPVLFADLLFPWALLLVVPIFAAWRPRAPDETPVRASIRRLLWLWVVVIVAAFSMSQTKEDLYILPVVPAASALLADALVGSGFGATSPALRRLVAAVAVVSGCFAMLLYWLFGQSDIALRGAGPAAAVLIGGAAVTLIALVAGRARGAVLTLAGTFAVFNYLLAVWLLPSVERFKPVTAIARTIQQSAPADARIGTYHLMLPSLVYYAGRPIEELGLDDQVFRFFDAEYKSWAMTSETDYERLKSIAPSICIVERQPLLEITLGTLVAGKPLRNVFLVTNQCGR